MRQENVAVLQSAGQVNVRGGNGTPPSSLNTLITD
jgi:hypothetical protein